MKRILLFGLLAAGAILMAVPAQAATPVHAAVRFHGGFHGGHTHVFVGWGWGPGWGWGWGWGYPGYLYEPYPRGYAYGPPVWARVKTDVEPDEARLYLDGQLIGTADDFDGWPDYLYLKRGHYRLEFRLDGYETKTVELDARPGQTLRIEDKLKKIPGAKRHGSYEEPKIEGGIRRFWGKRNEIVEPVSPYGGRDDNRSIDYERDPGGGYAPDRAPSRETRSRGDDWRGNQRPPDATAQAPRAETRSTKSRLQLHVDPADAAVYVDDRFVGTAEELNSLDRGLAVPAGKHTVTVSRPGFRDRSVEIEVNAGGSETVEVSLTR